MDNKTQIEIANQTGDVEKELSLKEISQLFVQNWPLFLVLFIAFNSIGVVFYKYFDPYVSKATIIVNDSLNSQLQSYAQSNQGLISKTNEAKKSNSAINKRLDYFSTRAFLDEVLKQIIEMPIDKLTVKESEGLVFIKQNVLKNKLSLSYDEKTEVFRFFESTIAYKVKTDFELEISASHDRKEVALLLAKIVSQQALTYFKSKELDEINLVKNHLMTEKENIDQDLADINKKMSLFANKPETLISIGSKEKISDYLADLTNRKSEVKIKIAENDRIISELKQGSSKHNLKKESNLYGNGGKAQALALENDILKSKLEQIQTAINDVAMKAKNLPYLSQMYEDLKKRSEIGLSRLKDVNDNLTKVNMAVIAANQKFEMYESPRYEKIGAFVPLMIIIFLAVLLTQILGSLIIYLRAIWDTNIITAQSTRNVVVVDSHSLDPRVIIENSKIRFRLKNNTMSEDDPEFVKKKNIGFGLTRDSRDDESASASEEG